MMRRQTFRRRAYPGSDVAEPVLHHDRHVGQLVHRRRNATLACTGRDRRCENVLDSPSPFEVRDTRPEMLVRRGKTNLAPPKPSCRLPVPAVQFGAGQGGARLLREQT